MLLGTLVAWSIHSSGVVGLAFALVVLLIAAVDAAVPVDQAIVFRQRGRLGNA